MANEIGYWNGGAGATTVVCFPDEYLSPVTAANAYTAVSGDAITAVRFSRTSSGGTFDIGIALYAYDSGLDRPTGAALQTTTISGSTTAGTFSAVVNWPLSAGSSYVLAAGDPTAPMSFTSDSLANGTSGDDSGDATFPTWGHTGYRAHQIELAGDVTNTPSATTRRGMFVKGVS